ncbi:MAG: hypothetical protein DME72_04900 [Verrucomicrobia bacterium]|nr:MAG: hypothetical protein DME72_04900 [Verrucomicrobiota bacterium]
MPLALHVKQLRLLCAAFDRQVDSVRCSAQDESTLKIAQRFNAGRDWIYFPEFRRRTTKIELYSRTASAGGSP